jgi:uncharacterized protein YkwD
VLPRTRAALVAAVAIAVAGASVNAFPAAPRAQARNIVRAMPALAVRILARINVDRARHGLGPLHFSPLLRAAAGFHSYEMAEGGFFSHTSMDGTPCWTRLARFYGSARYSHWEVGETLEWSSGGTTAAEVVRDWLLSPEHRRVVLARGFREIGIFVVHASAASGSFDGAAVTFVTADFGARMR